MYLQSQLAINKTKDGVEVNEVIDNMGLALNDQLTMCVEKNNTDISDMTVETFIECLVKANAKSVNLQVDDNLRAKQEELFGKTSDQLVLNDREKELLAETTIVNLSENLLEIDNLQVNKITKTKMELSGYIQPLLGPSEQQLVNNIFNSKDSDENKTIRLCAFADVLCDSNNSYNKIVGQRLSGKFFPAEVMETNRFSPLYQAQYFLIKSIEVNTKNDKAKAFLQFELTKLLAHPQSSNALFVEQTLQTIMTETKKLINKPKGPSLFFSSRLMNFLKDMNQTMQEYRSPTPPSSISQPAPAVEIVKAPKSHTKLG